jgi:hypothetical protein
MKKKRFTAVISLINPGEYKKVPVLAESAENALTEMKNKYGDRLKSGVIEGKIVIPIIHYSV